MTTRPALPGAARYGAAILGILIVTILPLVTGEFVASVSVVTGIYVILLVGLSLFLGYGGQFSFAQAVFYGIGAYTSAILVTKWNVPVLAAFAAAACLGGIVAFVLSAPILRLEGYYLAMATLAFCQIFHVLVVENFSITGGPTGIYSIPSFSVFGLELSTARSYHYAVWLVAIGCMAFAHNLMHSRIGRALKAIQSSDEAARALGIDVTGLRTAIFVLTGVTGAMAGSFFAHYVSYISPGTFTLDLSIWLVVVLTVGGIRTVWGVVLAALFTTVFPFLLGSYQKYNMLVFGLILILVLRFMPGGIAAFLEDAAGRVLRRGAAKNG